MHRIERSIGILKHDLQLLPHLEAVLPGKLQNVLHAAVLVKIHASGRRLVQADDALAERRLSAAGLADDPKGLAAQDAERRVIDGLYRPVLSVFLLPGEIFLAQILHHKQLLSFCFHHFPSS